MRISIVATTVTAFSNRVIFSDKLLMPTPKPIIVRRSNADNQTIYLISLFFTKSPHVMIIAKIEFLCNGYRKIPTEQSVRMSFVL